MAGIGPMADVLTSVDLWRKRLELTTEEVVLEERNLGGQSTTVLPLGRVSLVEVGLKGSVWWLVASAWFLLQAGGLLLAATLAEEAAKPPYWVVIGVGSVAILLLGVYFVARKPGITVSTGSGEISTSSWWGRGQDLVGFAEDVRAAVCMAQGLGEGQDELTDRQPEADAARVAP